jgi:hypothetical protein
MLPHVAEIGPDDNLIYYRSSTDAQDQIEKILTTNIIEFLFSSYVSKYKFIPPKKISKVDILNGVDSVSKIEFTYYLAPNFPEQNNPVEIISRTRRQSRITPNKWESLITRDLSVETEIHGDILTFESVNGGSYKLVNVSQIYRASDYKTAKLSRIYLPFVNDYLKSDHSSSPSCDDLKKNYIGIKGSPVRWIKSYNAQFITRPTKSLEDVMPIASSNNKTNVSDLDKDFARQQKFVMFRDTFGATFGNTSYRLKNGKWVKGVAVYGIIPNSPADKLGLQTRDQIIKFGNAEINFVDELNVVLSSINLNNINDEISVIRNQEIVKINVNR